jgi:hypothetical protein
MSFSLGASFRVTVPMTMIRSQARSEPKASRAPKRSMSNLEPAAAPTSTEQQAVSRWTGQREYSLPQLAR